MCLAIDANHLVFPNLSFVIMWICCGQVGEPKFVFEAKTIQRMELLVLSTLKWKMQVLTPCSFIDYFLSKICNDQYPSSTTMSRSLQLILSTIRGFYFTFLFVMLLFFLLHFRY